MNMSLVFQLNGLILVVDKTGIPDQFTHADLVTEALIFIY